MGFRSLRDCVDALVAARQAVVVEHPVDPHLEIAEIQRRLFRAGGPAVLFNQPQGSVFPVLVNLYGTRSRIERIFADTLDRCLLYTSPSPRDLSTSRMPSSA